MARQRKSSNELDGFHALKAAQQAQKDGKYPAEPQTPTKAEAGKPKPASRIGRTAMPTKVEVVCYECGYSFEIVGKTDQTVCSKCRVRLPVAHHTIDSAWSDEIVTAGTVTITSDAVIEGGSIIANKVELAGSIKGGEIFASRLLDLQAGASFQQEQVRALDLLIGEGVKHALKGKGMQFRNVEVKGELKADLNLEGKLVVRASGCFQGTVASPGLEVEEGGGLKAKLNVKPGISSRKPSKKAS